VSEIDIEDEVALRSYSRRVGERLRAIRRQRRLSLQEVEAQSALEFKASVLGAYERGERSISVPRLQRLAAYYGVPVDQLLPVAEGMNRVIDLRDGQSARYGNEKVVIDLTKVNGLLGPESMLLSRYLSMIQLQRQDFNGRMLTIRNDDLRMMACILACDIDQVRDRLDELGLCLSLSS
jgi:transcriptional regulator with XRE-family HTH domain